VRIKPKYRNTLTHYLEWITDDFLRPKFEYDEAGQTAEEAMFMWETHGQALPKGCKEPDLLAKYVQGKTSRDFYIKNWREDIKQGQAWPEEFLFTLGFDESEFRSVFGRDPEPMTVLYLGMGWEFLKLTEGIDVPFVLFLYERQYMNLNNEVERQRHVIEAQNKALAHWRKLADLDYVRAQRSFKALIEAKDYIEKNGGDPHVLTVIEDALLDSWIVIPKEFK